MSDHFGTLCIKRLKQGVNYMLNVFERNLAIKTLRAWGIGDWVNPLKKGNSPQKSFSDDVSDDLVI